MLCRQEAEILSAFTKRIADMSFVMSTCLPVRPSAWNNDLVPTRRIFGKFGIVNF
jgi:hypothetical protein